MSIADSTTTLDTAWTEQSIAEFTAGILSNEAACVTEVGSKLKRGTLGATTTPTDTQVKNWLARAKMELAETKNFSFNRKFAQASLSVGAYRVSLPNDFNGGINLIRDTTNDVPITIYDSAIFDKMYPDLSAESQGMPQDATVKNNELWIGPPVDGTTVIEIEYSRSGAATTASSFAWLPEIERFRCCDFATGMAFESLHQYQVADRYLSRFYESLGKAIKADGRRKWGKRVTCINVFQEYHAVNSQGYRTR